VESDVLHSDAYGMSENRLPASGVVVLQDIEEALLALSPNKVPKSQHRVCDKCGARLSRYNPSPNQCALHTPPEFTIPDHR
jgi:hypothetical protein